MIVVGVNMILTDTIIRVTYAGRHLRIEPYRAIVAPGARVVWQFVAEGLLMYGRVYHVVFRFPQTTPFTNSILSLPIVATGNAPVVNGSIQSDPVVMPGDHKYDVVVQSPQGTECEEDPWILVR
jgi:hypothetical protein